MALESALKYILNNANNLRNKRIFIGTDAQCILRAMDIGPIHPYSYLGLDVSTLWQLIFWIMDFCKELVIHYVPGHVDLIGNEIADTWAKHATTFFNHEQQNQISTSLSNLKAYLRKNSLNNGTIA